MDTTGEGRAGKSVVCFKNLVIIFDQDTFHVPPVAYWFLGHNPGKQCALGLGTDFSGGLVCLLF